MGLTYVNTCWIHAIMEFALSSHAVRTRFALYCGMSRTCAVPSSHLKRSERFKCGFVSKRGRSGYEACAKGVRLKSLKNQHLAPGKPVLMIIPYFAVLKPGCMEKANPATWQSRLHNTIYESNTVAGKAFDVALLILIISSIVVVMLDSVDSYHNRYGHFFWVMEWIFTGLFTLEYILRLISIQRPLRYVISFLGLIDLLAVLPSYLSIFFVGAQSLLVLRALRLLRVFRIFKLTHFLTEMEFLKVALTTSLKKITIFMLAVLSLVIILGSIMYLVENGQNGFISIPESIYWAIVTITTVGYGDIAPVTPGGKFIASLVMFIGYGIIAVPTGIITTEMAQAARLRKHGHETCPGCGREGHDKDAAFCKFCGTAL
jgi:voltage-gated potassium channel